MAIGNQYLTEINVEQTQTMPGMAHFAGTGPAGKTCGDCVNRGYHRKRIPKFDARINDWVEKSYKVNGCAKYNQLTGKHGGVIDPRLHACRYFEEKPSEQPTPSQGPSQARD